VDSVAVRGTRLLHTSAAAAGEREEELVLIKSLVHFISLIKQAEAVFELQGRARNSEMCERTD
jgi:hypothetical protein